MKSNIIGRDTEQQALQDILQSEISEFVAVYGRRRVGKTFLVRETVTDQFVFEISGLAKSKTKSQLLNFTLTLNKASGESLKPAGNWLEAFAQLIDFVERSPQKRKILFFDEMPWMDTPRSDFLPALEHFWNAWASARKDIVLIACGSATSWIINNLLNNHGGLHNRLTASIFLKPFTLLECEMYFKAKKIELSRTQIAEYYMIMGGIPFYLSKIKKGLSLAQNIDNLFFMPKGELRNEFNNLYAALFNKSEEYIKLVEALGKKGKGLTRSEIEETAKIKAGGTLTKILQNLEYCGFIRKYGTFNRKKRDMLYQLIDPFTLFYFKFIAKNEYNDEHFWANSLDTPLHNTWVGLAFELLALLHTAEIKQALGIAGIQASVSTWRSETSSPAAQIDLVINRKDGIINLVEIKFAGKEFAITKDYDANLRNKIFAFKDETRTRKAVHLLMLTTFGVKQNKYSEMVQKELKLKDLFR
ncbi:AAA family ATPase [Candidatus Symbiothrix dinenymphae]|uniref:AAA family ATPase n=1 Tax=Candidatus Symbiothrix dinenymphae TaxID=467085 RepID=UPI0006C621F7|nr:ATP-binding protein [Candidatus Symbiothrix dinenymphae]GAP73350.1 ATPase [Candidatus Symbiothrix dinenymphae]